jgi:hypothetical protein
MCTDIVQMCYSDSFLEDLCYTAPVYFNMYRMFDSCVVMGFVMFPSGPFFPPSTRRHEGPRKDDVMVLREDQSEQNQQTWLSRSARERQKISVSVEETLEDPLAEEAFWADEEDGHTNFHRSMSQDRSLVPPRLSLQSRVMVAVDSQRPAENDGAAIDDPQKGISADGVDVGNSNATIHNTNILMRFAQRLTSSLNALGSVSEDAKEGQEHEALLLAHDAHDKEQALQQAVQPLMIGGKASSLAAIANVEVYTASTTENLLIKEIPPHPMSSMAESDAVAAGAQERQRLAGRNTKIRLEVVPGPASARSKSRAKKLAPGDNEATSVEHSKEVPALATSREGARTSETGAHRSVVQEWFDSREMPGASSSTLRSVPLRETETTSTGLAAIRAARAGKGVEGSSSLTWGDLPAIDASQRMTKSVTRGTLSGSGVLANGQSEVTVENPYITATSVVLVTLTSNPGPVVVQYVSLQPGISFTIHLTAPTMMRTTFNYIVLLGELF